MRIAVIDSGQKIITNGLLLHLDAAQLRSYPGTGTTWTDISGNGNNGTLVNGPTYSTSNGGLIVLDGTNDYCTLTNAALNTNNATIELWIKPDAVTNDVRYFDRCNTSCGTLSMIRLFSANELRFNVRNASNSVNSVLITAGVSNNWNQYVIAYDGTTQSNYVNGALDSSVGFISGNLNTGGTFSLTLGAAAGGTAAYAKGSVGITRYYNRGLTATEVLQNYNATKSRFGL